MSLPPITWAPFKPPVHAPPSPPGRKPSKDYRGSPTRGSSQAGGHAQWALGKEEQPSAYPPPSHPQAQSADALAKGWCPHGPLAGLTCKQRSSPLLPAVPGWSAGPVLPKPSPERHPPIPPCVRGPAGPLRIQQQDRRGRLGVGGHQDLHSGAELKTETGSRTPSRTV